MSVTENRNFPYKPRLVNYIQLYAMAISIAFLCLTLLTKVRRFYRSLLIDIQWILGAVLAPMPVVILASPNILHHSNHPLPVEHSRLLVLSIYSTSIGSRLLALRTQISIVLEGGIRLTGTLSWLTAFNV